MKVSNTFIATLCLLPNLLFSQNKVAGYEPQIFREFKKDSRTSQLPDFSYAGYHYGEAAIPHRKDRLFDVTKHGVVANSKADQTGRVQQLIDSVGKMGGGIIYFPKGRYLFNMNAQNKKGLQLNYSHVVIRGAGSGKDGTVFYNGNDLLQYDKNPWLSPFFIQTGYNLQGPEYFWGLDYPAEVKASLLKDKMWPGDINAPKILTTIVADAAKGDRVLKLQSAAQIKAGDVILIGMYNADDEGTLIKELIKPYKKFADYHKVANNAGRLKAPSFQWLVEVESVINTASIKLKQPLRQGINLLRKPVIAEAPMLTEIGIESIRIESAWKGEYCHHGCDKKDKYGSQMMDYGWNAINYCRVTHSWIKDVTMADFTNPIYLLDSRNVTVDGLRMEGFDGHSGIKIYGHAADNLIQNIDFHANYTHILSGEGNAIGNVFTSIRYHPFERIPGDFDFHGFADDRFAPPSQNLFENCTGMHQISGGGGPSKLPHTGNSNTWWNIEGKGFKKSKEVFVSWLYQTASYNHPQKDHHILYPQSILIGYYNPDEKLEINGSTADVKNEWIYTENFNKGRVLPNSLYKEQLRLRQKSKGK